MAVTLHSTMRFFRAPQQPVPGLDEGSIEWEDTRPSQMDEPMPRQQPPLKEVLQGLDARELEGQTVFDQLFGLDRPH